MNDFILPHAITEMRRTNTGFRGPSFVFNNSNTGSCRSQLQHDDAQEWPKVNETVKQLLSHQQITDSSVLGLFEANIYVLQSMSRTETQDGQPCLSLPKDREGLKKFLQFTWPCISWSSYKLECSAYVEDFFRQGRNPSLHFHRVIVSQICLMHLRLGDLKALLNKEDESNPEPAGSKTSSRSANKLKFKTSSILTMKQNIPEIMKYEDLLDTYPSNAIMTERDFLTLAVECDLTWDKSWQALHDHLGSEEELVEIQGVGSMTKLDIGNLLLELQRTAASS